jgi:hypothetical protein
MVSATLLRSDVDNPRLAVVIAEVIRKCVYTIVQSLDCHFFGLMWLAAFIAIGEPYDRHTINADPSRASRARSLNSFVDRSKVQGRYKRRPFSRLAGRVSSRDDSD